MSKTGPNAFVVIGDTDWWSTTYRHVDVAMDSRLRGARTAAAANWRTVLGAQLQVAIAEKQYAELGVIGVTPFIGLFKESQQANAATIGNYPGALTDTVGLYMADRGIYFNAAGIAAANINTATAPAAPYTLGLMYWLNSSDLPVVRFLLNGRRNIIGYSEDFGNAAWTKVNGGTAVGQAMTFVNNNSAFHQAITEAGGVGSTFTFSALISCTNSTTLQLALTDDADASPFHSQSFSVGPTTVRCTLTATMGAGYSGTLSVRFVGNAVITAGSVVTATECSVNAGLELDPYQAQTGAAGGYVGPPVTLTAGNYRIATSFTHANAEVVLRVDQDDLQYPQSDCQPWGAAARVSDAGGYSPAASLISAYGNNIGVDSQLRTATDLSGISATGDSARTNKASHGTQLLYAEFPIEAGINPLIGLCNASYSMEAAYVGVTGTAAFGYYAGTGGVQINSVVVATYATFTTGDRIGVILDPATGKFWLKKNDTLQAGDPEAGTGQTGTLTDGPWYPAATPYGANTRVRFCTHSREQLYRPSYAKAWDGADILPEPHYKGRLAGDTELTTSIHLPFPWGGSRRTGSPLGSVVIDNSDGLYDSVRTYALRDQELAIYELVDGLPDYFAKVLCDSVRFESESRMSVASRGLDSKLDIRIDEQALLIGRANGQIKSLPVSGASLVWDLVHTPYVVLDTVMDQGVAVTRGTSWVYARSEQAQGFRRLVNPAGKMTGSGATFRPMSQVSLTNGDFSSWTGDNPNSWTVTESAGTAEIKQSGNAARFHRTSGSATCQIVQSISTSVADLEQLFAIITVSAYVAGDIQVAGSSGVFTNVGVNGAGTYYVPLNVYLPSSDITIRCDPAVTDLSIDTVAVWLGGRTDQRDVTYSWLLETYGGLTSAQYSLGTMPAAYSDSAFIWGYWSENRPTVRQVLDTMNPSLLLDYFTASNGVLKFVAVLNPNDQTTTATLLELDALGPLSVRDDLAPALTNKFLYTLNWEQYQDSELAGSVSSADRVLRTERGIPYTSTALGSYHSFYAHANGAPEFEAMHSVSPANTLALTLVDMYETKKEFFERPYKLSPARVIDPGEYVTLYANRFGLTAGKKVMLVSKTRSLLSPVVNCTFWG